MTACNQEVFPPAVIDSVTNQMDVYEAKDTAANCNSEIPRSMQVRPCLAKAPLGDALMVELQVNEDPQQEHSDSNRENDADDIPALSLTVFAAMYPECVEGFGIFGVVKETSVRGLGEFIQKYFRNYPVYCDKTYAFYQALGDRKVGLRSLFNPLSLAGILCDALQRMKKKEITGNVTAGEGVVQGGIILFNKAGRPVAMYPEETGNDLRVADIAKALNAIRRMADDGNDVGSH